MNRLCIVQQYDAQSASVCLINSLPSPDAAVVLNYLRIGSAHNSFDPFRPDIPPIRAHPRMQEVLRELHADIVLRLDPGVQQGVSIILGQHLN